MKELRRFLLLVLAVMLPPLAAALSATDPSSLPSLESFFAESARFAERVSPDGKRVAYLGPDAKGINRLWMVGTDRPEIPVRISQTEGPAVSTFFWIGDTAIFWQSSGADGQTRFFLGTLDNATVREILPNETRVMSLAGIVDSADPCILVGLSDGSNAFPDLFRVKFGGNGKPELVCANNRHHIITWAWDKSGVPVAGLRWTDGGAKEILNLRDGTGNVVFRAAAADDARLLFASADGSHVLVLTNKDSDLTRLEQIDLLTGKRQVLASDPIGRVDVEQVVVDAGGTNILAVGYPAERIRWQVLDPTFATMLEDLEKLPDTRCMSVLGFNADRKHCLLQRFSDRDPGTVYLYGVESRCLRMLWRDSPETDRSMLCETKAFNYAARDACRIPAFLTVPRGTKPPWPLVVFPHGGPRMRTSPGFDGRVQFLASRGYAVLQPNFRGSRGYGKAFMNAGDGQWGRGVMQTDVTDGVNHLVTTGMVDKRRVAILGGSYGGYAALAGLTFTPDQYAAGICLFGISDLLTYAAFAPTEWLPYAGDTVRRLGDPTTAAGRAVLNDLSPVNHAALLMAPLLIYHGARDNLIPVSHARRMAAALLNSGKRVDYLLAANEAHGFVRPESEMAVYRAIEIFLHEHIGGQVGPEPAAPVCRKLTAYRKAGDADVRSCRGQPDK
jgi:dipeptidyl aminopeptidase/acylaminoacyl peptidase